MSKETVYDSEIAPLMDEIIATCKRAGISVHASFHLDGDLFCTTHLEAPDNEDTDEGREGRASFLKRYVPIVNEVRDPPLFAFTITSLDKR